MFYPFIFVYYVEVRGVSFFFVEFAHNFISYEFSILDIKLPHNDTFALLRFSMQSSLVGFLCLGVESVLSILYIFLLLYSLFLCPNSDNVFFSDVVPIMVNIVFLSSVVYVCRFRSLPRSCNLFNLNANDKIGSYCKILLRIVFVFFKYRRILAKTN